LDGSIGEVFVGVVEGSSSEVKAHVDAALERAILSKHETVTKLWQNDEDHEDYVSMRPLSLSACSKVSSADDNSPRRHRRVPSAE
jgi:hypothetical protein